MKMGKRKMFKTGFWLSTLLALGALQGVRAQTIGFCYSTQLGGSGSGNGQFVSPSGVAVDNGTGNIYVCDYSNSNVQVLDSTGAFLYKWGSLGSGDSQFSEPIGLWFANNQVYVGEAGNNRVQVFSAYSGGSVGFLFKFGNGGTGNGQFDRPQGLCTDPSGNIYVSDGTNYRVQKFSPTGAWTWTIGTTGTTGSGNGQFAWPNDVAVDPTGQYLYVSDAETGAVVNERIQKFDLNGNYIAQWGGSGTGNGKFSSIRGVATDCGGNVYATDFNNPRVQVFDANGNYLTQFGSSSQFLSPQAITLDKSANVYIGDWDGSKVVKYSLCSGSVSCLFTPTPTPTGTPSSTPTPTASSTPTLSPTRTLTSTPTNTPTLTPTLTASPTLTSTPTPSPTGSVPSGTCFVYPSPATGSQASVSYNMAEAGQAELKVWNWRAGLAGHWTYSGSAGSQTQTFDISGFEPGVYLYVVSFHYASGRTDMCGPHKFAVVR